MPFAIRRISDGAFMTRGKVFEVDAEDRVRLFTGSGHASAALKHMYPPKEGEAYEVEVVEIEWRIVRTKQRYEVFREAGRYSKSGTRKLKHDDAVVQASR